MTSAVESSSSVAATAVPSHLTPITDPTDPSLPTLAALFSSTSPPLRLQAELEFLSLLANPFYLHHLAAQSYLHQPSFLVYLAYLLRSYSAPPLVALLPFPHSLHNLRLLVESAEFRAQCGRREYVDMLHAQQFWHWRSFRYGRYREDMENREKEGKHADDRKAQQARLDNGADDGERDAVGQSTEVRRQAVKMEDAGMTE